MNLNYFLLFIVCISSLILINVLICKKEAFSIRLEKQTTLYNDYRNYIEGKDYLMSRHRKDKRLIPYNIDKTCFSKMFQVCNKYSPFFLRDSAKCEDVSFDMCNNL